MKLSVKESVLFGLLGAIMYASKLFMEVLPNIHLLGTLTIAYTIAFKKKALYPIYIYVFINGLLSGFSLWWIPYLYIWTLLWGIVMVLSDKIDVYRYLYCYMIINALHGFLFGTMYAPLQAIVFHLSFDEMIAWIVAGIPFDIIHGISNFFCGLLIVPIVRILLISKKNMK